MQFDIYRNGQYAGYHNIDFTWSEDGSLEVQNTIEFGVKKLVLLCTNINLKVPRSIMHLVKWLVLVRKLMIMEKQSFVILL